MRIFKLTLIAVAAIFAWSAAAQALEVKKRREAPGKPAEVWAVVGDFCAIKDWHPAVTECEKVEEGGDTYRLLTLKDGGKIKEKLTKQGEPAIATKSSRAHSRSRTTKRTFRSTKMTSLIASRSCGSQLRRATAWTTPRPRRSSPASSMPA